MWASVPASKSPAVSGVCGAAITTKSLAGEEVGQAVQSLDLLDPLGGRDPLGKAVDGADGHAEGQGPPGDLAADAAEADDPHRRVGQEDRRPVHRVDRARARAAKFTRADSPPTGS